MKEILVRVPTYNLQCRMYEEKLENERINEVSELLWKCSQSLSRVCEDVQRYLESVPEAELHQNLLPPAYLELLRRRDNLVDTIVALASNAEKGVEATSTDTSALVKRA